LNARAHGITSPRAVTIYRDPRDYQHFGELLAEAVERFRWRLHAYVLMKNHFHLMVETRDPNLSHSMQWLGASDPAPLRTPG
jgi:REP element-mobilizing transposase RayT